MANQSDEQRIPSLYPNPLLGSQSNHQTILKLQAKTLFLKLTQLEDKLKHYSNMIKKME